MSVIIGVDPHKATHTAVAVDCDEVELARARVRATRNQVPQLLAWAEPLGERTWAIESAGGLGYLLSQQLVAAGETVLDVPSTLAARIRVLGSRRSDKNDPNDALSVAVAAMRTPELPAVVRADHAEMLRLLAKRNIDIGNQRTRVVCRLHNLLMELRPGGIGQELYASHAQQFLDDVHPTSPPEHARARPTRPRPRAARRHPRPRRTAQGVPPADPHRGSRVEHIGHRHLRDRADHRLLPDRLHRRHQPLREPGRLRRLQRHRPSRTVIGRPGRAPRVPTREPQAQPRTSPRRDLPDPQPRHRGPDLLRGQGRRGQDQEGRHPLAQAARLQRRLPPAPRRPPEPDDVAGPGGHPGTSLSSSVAGFHPAHRLFGPSHFPDPAATLRPPPTGMLRRAEQPLEIES
jgi:Transposase